MHSACKCVLISVLARRTRRHLTRRRRRRRPPPPPPPVLQLAPPPPSRLRCSATARQGIEDTNQQ